MHLTNYLKEKLAKHTAGIEAYTMPTTLYLSLHSATTGDDGSGSELTGSGYARVLVGFEYSAGPPIIARSAAVEEFPQATANWIEAVDHALYDAPTGGNMLFHAALSSPVTVLDTQTLRYAINTITIGFDVGV